MKSTATKTLAVLATGLAFYGSCAMAQDNTQPAPPAPADAGNNGGQNQGGGRRGGGGGGNFDPAQFQQRMNDRMKQMLKVSDEEWGVIQPLLEKVQTAQREVGGGRGGFGRGGGGPGGNRQGGQPSPGAQPAQGGQGAGGNRGNRGGPTMPEADALRAALDSDSTPADEIKTKLAALRDARKKATAQLEQARADLQKVLTARQEAALVLAGVLE